MENTIKWIKASQLRSGATGRVEVLRAWDSHDMRFATFRRLDDLNEVTDMASGVLARFPVLLAEVGQHRRSACGRLIVTIVDFIPSFASPWEIRKPWGTRGYFTADELLAEHPEVVELKSRCESSNDVRVIASP